MAEADRQSYELILQKQPDDDSGYISYTIKLDDNDIFTQIGANVKEEVAEEVADEGSKNFDLKEESDDAVIISDDSNSNDCNLEEEAKVDVTAPEQQCTVNTEADSSIVLSSDDSNSNDCIDDEITSGLFKPRRKNYNILQEEFPESRDSSDPHKIVYTCPICLRFSGDRKAKVSIHISTVHKVEKYYVCHACPFRTGSKTGLKSHLSAVHKVRPYSCSICPFMALDRSDLSRHRSSVHDRVMNFLCSMCCFRAASRRLLIKHLSTVHAKSEASKRIKQKVRASETGVV